MAKKPATKRSSRSTVKNLPAKQLRAAQAAAGKMPDRPILLRAGLSRIDELRRPDCGPGIATATLMMNTRKRRQNGTTAPPNRSAKKKNANVGDLPDRTDRTGATRGGATVAADGRQTAVYQHNQTDLEFVRAPAGDIKGGALTGPTAPAPRRTKNDVSLESLEIAHEGFND